MGMHFNINMSGKKYNVSHIIKRNQYNSLQLSGSSLHKNVLLYEIYEIISRVLIDVEK